MRLLFAFTITLYFATPSHVTAAILINEIAWMGSVLSPNDEWVELYNSGGGAVSLEGWTLTDNNSLEIELAGTIGAGEFAVLERTDDDSAPGTAFLIYTGALANDGRTLTVKRQDGSIEDQVAGGENWEALGGDNATKDTAQRTNAGWITAPPTPGMQNASVASPPKKQEESEVLEPEDQKAVQQETTGGNKRISLTPSTAELRLSIISPEIAYVNQPVSLSVEPSGIGASLMDSLVYSWNFGDSYTGNGKEVEHTFRYPGTYVIFAEGAYARHESIARQKLTVLPVTFSITRGETGEIQIHNDAPYEIDLGGFTVRGDEEIVLPEHTILLPNATLALDRSRLEVGTEKFVALFDSKKQVVASALPSVLDQTSVQEVPSTPPSRTLATKEHTPQSQVPRTPPQVTTTLATTTAVQRLAPAPLEPAPIVQTAATAESVPSVLTHPRLPYYGLIALVLLGLIALFMLRRAKT